MRSDFSLNNNNNNNSSNNNWNNIGKNRNYKRYLYAQSRREEKKYGKPLLLM